MINHEEKPTASRDRSPETPSETIESKIEVTLLDYLALLLRHKKMIAQVTAVTFVLSILVSLLIPVRYAGTVHILPPQQSSGSLGTLLQQTEGMFGGFMAGLKEGKTTAELYAGILQSRTVADELVTQFKLKKRYGLDYIEDVYKKLAKRTTILIDNKNRIISVSVEDRDQQRSADMANAYAAALDRIYRSLSVTEGQKKREFLEGRLAVVKEDLRRAESALKAYQEKYQLVEPKEQAAAAIEVAGKIKGEIIATQTELEVLRQFGTEQQNEAVMLKTKIVELQRQLAKMERGPSNEVKTAQAEAAKESDLFIPIGDLPGLGMQLTRLTREAKVQEKVFELVTTQFEMAKMEEARDMPLVQVLDKAVPPEKKSYPRRVSMVLLNTFTAFILTIVLALVMDYAQRLKYARPDQYNAITAHFRSRFLDSLLARLGGLHQRLGHGMTRVGQTRNKKK